MEKDAMRGAARLEDLARIYTMVGDYDKAVEKLKILLNKPSFISAPLLRVHPDWAPLRNEYSNFPENIN